MMGQTSNRTICAGTNTSFSITATSTGPLSYRWQVNPGSGFVDLANGGVYNGGSSNTLTITGVTYSMNGYVYRSLVRSGTCGYITTGATATLTINSTPSITVRPVSLTICLGAPVTFSVTVSPTVTPAATYQWRKGVVNIFGAIGSTYTISSIAAGDAGSYDVVLTNICGVVTSDQATVTINQLPTCSITDGFDAVRAGSTTTWNATAGMLSYSWTGPGGFIATTQSITFGVAGSYTVTITDVNGCQSTCSRTLTVNPLPTTSPIYHL